MRIIHSSCFSKLIMGLPFVFMFMPYLTMTQNNYSNTFSFQSELKEVDSLIKTDINKAKLKTDILLLKYKETDTIIKLAKVLQKSIFIDDLLGNYKNAKEKLFRGLSIYKELNLDNEQAELYSLLGVVYENSGRFDSALISYQLSNEIYQFKGNKTGLAKSYLDIGVIYLRQSVYDKAKAYFFKSSQMSENIGSNSILASSFNNLGIIFDREKKYDSARIFYSKAIELQKNKSNNRMLAKLYHNLSLINNNLGDYDNAIIMINRSIEIKKKIGDLQGLSNSYQTLAQILFDLGKIDSTQKYLNESYQIAVKKNFTFILLRIYELQSLVLENKKQFSEALFYFKKFKSLNDSLTKLNINKEIMDLHSNFELNEKNKETIILKKEIEINEVNLEKQKIKLNLWLFISLSIILVFITLSLIYWYKTKLLRKNKLLSEKEKTLIKLQLIKQEQDSKFLLMEKKQAENEQKLLKQEFEYQKEVDLIAKQKLENYIQLKNNEIISLISQTASKNEILNKIKKMLKKSTSSYISYKEGALSILNEINNSFDLEIDWKKFKITLDETYPGFLDRLIMKHPDITINEQKLCSYLLINLPTKEIAQISNVTVSAVNKSRQRLRKKLGLSSEASITEYMKTI